MAIRVQRTGGTNNQNTPLFSYERGSGWWVPMLRVNLNKCQCCMSLSLRMPMSPVNSKK